MSRRFFILNIDAKGGMKGTCLIAHSNTRPKLTSDGNQTTHYPAPTTTHEIRVLCLWLCIENDYRSFSAKVWSEKKRGWRERKNDSKAGALSFSLSITVLIFSTRQSSQHTHKLAPYHNISLASHLRIVYSNGPYIWTRHQDVANHSISFLVVMIIVHIIIQR